MAGPHAESSTGESITGETITATWRTESARLVGALARMTRDLDLAEDLAQDALVSALEQWPARGVPANPGAWLMTTAKRRAVDAFRRAEGLRRRTEELGMPDLTSGGIHRGRRAPSHLPLLPPPPDPGVAGRADPAACRRPDDRR